MDWTYHGVELGELEVTADQASSSAAELHGHGRGAGLGTTEDRGVVDETTGKGQTSKEGEGGLHS